MVAGSAYTHSTCARLCCPAFHTALDAMRAWGGHRGARARPNKQGASPLSVCGAPQPPAAMKLRKNSTAPRNEMQARTGTSSGDRPARREAESSRQFSVFGAASAAPAHPRRSRKLPAEAALGAGG